MLLHLNILWWRAKGYTYFNVPLPGVKLFRQFPPRCLLCGRLENPLTHELLISIWGEVLRLDQPGKGWMFAWHCRQLHITQETGDAKPHFRLICRQHGGPITDRLTAITHKLPPASHPFKIRLSNWIHEARYWVHVVIRFLFASTVYIFQKGDSDATRV